jgi:hypothetical protein
VWGGAGGGGGGRADSGEDDRGDDWSGRDGGGVCLRGGGGSLCPPFGCATRPTCSGAVRAPAQSPGSAPAATAAAHSCAAHASRSRGPPAAGTPKWRRAPSRLGAVPQLPAVEPEMDDRRLKVIAWEVASV